MIEKGMHGEPGVIFVLIELANQILLFNHSLNDNVALAGQA
jgi:hypothetical protein